ncbi:hypothetical protein GGX14DRAFT_677730 [Mycena pura]|uniref:G domain-containing protein n=1 Tax=Mycena pura TaxID=153505 RepID=A0AAD6UUR6_9AGAR|nr:hypothetical protein GGX14DRAFT_677730 [Mycena pura]
MPPIFSKPSGQRSSSSPLAAITRAFRKTPNSESSNSPSLRMPADSRSGAQPRAGDSSFTSAAQPAANLPLDEPKDDIIGIRSKCPHFRILIIGRANAGKTTILKRVCSSVKAPEIYDVNGKKCKGNSAAREYSRVLTEGDPKSIHKP